MKLVCVTWTPLSSFSSDGKCRRLLNRAIWADVGAPLVHASEETLMCVAPLRL